MAINARTRTEVLFLFFSVISCRCFNWFAIIEISRLRLNNQLHHAANTWPLFCTILSRRGSLTFIIHDCILIMSLFALLFFPENQNFLNFPQGRFLSSFPQSSRNGFFPVPRQQSQQQQQPNPPGSYQQQDVYLDGPTTPPFFSSFQSFGGVSTIFCIFYGHLNVEWGIR